MLSDYQKAQLLHKHLTGDFKVYNSKKNKVSRSAWVKMIDTLVAAGYIDAVNATVTVKGQDYLNQNHLNISLSILS